MNQSELVTHCSMSTFTVRVAVSENENEKIRWVRVLGTLLENDEKATKFIVVIIRNADGRKCR